ncbi:MAG: M1 family aminopeptidase [Bacteroidales bacterium]
MKRAPQIQLRTIIIMMVTLMSCQPDEPREFTHYKINMSIDPVEQYIEVDCFLDITPGNPGDTIYFYLHRQLQIESLTVNGNKAIIIRKDTSDIRYMPSATRYSLAIEQPVDNTVALHLDYSGRITEWNKWSASVMGKDWTEMGLYFPWYPYNPAFNPITYEVMVKHDQEYQAFMIGNETKEDGYSIYRTDSPGNDMVLCMSKELKIISREIQEYNLKLAHTTLSEKLTDTLSYDMELILSLFGKWFPPGNNSISIVESMREAGGGYARIGGLYLPEFNETDFFESRKSYTRYLAHETAHLWWYRANTNNWEDWLNEGFAEYSALMVLRELYGQEYFNKWIENKKKRSEGVGPVWHANRNGDQAYTILYDKAPLLLYELEGRIGTDSLKQLMRDLIINKASTTDQFMHILEDLEGNEMAEWFLNKLKS